MNIYTLLLTAHITGAIVAMTVIITSFVCISRRKYHTYQQLATAIAAIGGFQLVSGAGLQLYTRAPQQLFCEKIVVYIFILAAAEWVLYRAMKKVDMPYPAKQILLYATVGITSCIFVI